MDMVASAASSTTVRALQLGKSWFESEAGGGLDRFFFELTRHLPEAGVEIESYVVGSTPPEEGGIRGLSSSTASLPRRLFDVHAALRAARLDRFDLVAAHFALYALPLLHAIPPPPLVVHFHGPWADESRAEGESPLKVRTKAALERLVYRRAQRFIVLSRAFRDVLHRSYAVPPSRIRIVPGGVDVDRFATDASRREARRRLGWPTDRPLLLAVRRLTRRMGLEKLVDAMATVRRTVPDALLLVAGRGPLAEPLRARIEARGLDDHVALLGFVPEADLPLAYRAADVSVVPSETLEGFGLITVESLAAGTPALVTPVGGLPEVVRGLSPNLVLPEDTVGRDAAPALGARLAAALNGSLALPPGHRCRAYARTHYDWPVIARQTRRIYEEVLR